MISVKLQQTSLSLSFEKLKLKNKKVKISSPQFLRGNNSWTRFKILQTQEQVTVKKEPWNNKRGENHLLIYRWEIGVLKKLFLKEKEDGEK